MKKENLIECLEKMKACFDPVAPNHIEALDEAITYIKSDGGAEVTLDCGVMPCDEKCPKCGSENIHRMFHAEGTNIDNDKYDKAPCRWTTGQCHSYKATKDLIRHHCRCCRHGWVNKPLPKRKKA